MYPYHTIQKIQEKDLIYFEIAITFVCKNCIFCETEGIAYFKPILLWDMNHTGHGIINNKKVLLLKNCLTYLKLFLLER